MATSPLGKELRKLRVEKDERLIDMADRVGTSASFISAVETGRKKPSSEFISAVLKSYKLVGSAADRILTAAAEAREMFKLQPTSAAGRQTADLLARKFNSLSESEMEKIRDILAKAKKG